MEFSQLLNFLGQLLEGTVVSLEVFFLTLLISLPLGFVVAYGRMSRNKYVSGLVNIYIMIMRGTPLILQLIFFYFAPYYIFGKSMSRFVACVVAFSVNYTAYFAEIYRSGLQSIPLEQHEACLVLGINPIDEFFNIKLVQVIRTVLPSLGNEVITLVKDTALAQTIGIIELFALAKKQSAALFSTMPIIIAGIFYFIMNAIVSWAFKKAEEKISYY